MFTTCMALTVSFISLWGISQYVMLTIPPC